MADTENFNKEVCRLLDNYRHYYEKKGLTRTQIITECMKVVQRHLDNSLDKWATYFMDEEDED